MLEPNDDLQGMLTPKIPTLNFEFSDCEEVLHEDVLHAIPRDDSRKHNITGCKCGFKEVRIGEIVIAVIHKAWDKRDILNMLYGAETLEEAHEMRLEYMGEVDFLFRKGEITNRERFNRWFLFEDINETVFRSN